jgi:5-methyltetrahydropteroyltriglutamate--homocysteine methyltransferase
MQRTSPPYRADHVGSLLRPAPVKEARARYAAGEITKDALEAVEDREIESVIRKQEAVGLHSITDGEFRRSWWNLDFLAGFQGTEWVKLEEGVKFKGLTTRAEGLRVSGKLGFKGRHPMVDHFKFLRTHTGQTPKMTIPSPSALYTRGGRTMVSEAVYPALDEFYADLINAYQKVIRAFYDAGCRYLQLDEVYIALWCDPEHRKMLKERGDDPEQMFAAYIDMINSAVRVAPADMTIAMHLCRGNHRSTFLGEGGYEPVADALFNKINVNNYFMEFDTERAGGFEPLRLAPKTKTVVLGLVTTKVGHLEDRDAIKRRLEAASKFADIERLCLSPQCGFASTEEGNVLTEEEQWAKLRLIAEIADEVWG